jgi:hypothetical protein
VAALVAAAAAAVVVIHVLNDNLVSPLFVVVILGRLFSLMLLLRGNFEQVRLKPALGKLYQASADVIHQNGRRRRLTSQDLLVQLINRCD